MTIPKTTCPVCAGTGAGYSLHGPSSIGEGAHIMVQSEKAYTRVLVTGFKHSGAKLINDGLYTFRYPGGQEVSRTCGDPGDSLKRVCARCLGDKTVELNDRDRSILGSDSFFLVSGKGRVCLAFDGTGWWKFRFPNIGRADLLTNDAGMVFKMEGHPETTDSYQSFHLAPLGNTDVSDDTPSECATHGWYFDAECPECPA